MGVALARTMGGRAFPRRPLAYLLALAVGVTWATNALGGELWVGGLAVAVVAGWAGWRHRTDETVLLAVAAAPAILLLAAHSLLG